jgi:hypothetical protein
VQSLQVYKGYKLICEHFHRRINHSANIIIQNPPHPLKVWQQAQGKWQAFIKLLEAIPENLPAYIQAQEKLVTYQTNYAALRVNL